MIFPFTITCSRLSSFGEFQEASLAPIGSWSASGRIGKKQPARVIQFLVDQNIPKHQTMVFASHHVFNQAPNTGIWQGETVQTRSRKEWNLVKASYIAYKTNHKGFAWSGASTRTSISPEGSLQFLTAGFLSKTFLLNHANSALLDLIIILGARVDCCPGAFVLFQLSKSKNASC